MRSQSLGILTLGLTLALTLGACGSSDDDSGGSGGSSGSSGSGGSGGGKCSTSALSCGDFLTAGELTTVETDVTNYSEDGKLPCQFDLPSEAGGIFQAFCGSEDLLARQLATANSAYPGAAMETDTIGTKSFELIVDEPGTKYSTTEVDALTTSGKYVFNVALVGVYSDIEASRQLARLIDANLSDL